MSRRLLPALLIGLAVVLPAGGGESKSLTYEDLFGNPVVVKGQGFEIRQKQWDDNFRALKATLATQDQAIPPDREADARARLLDRMILARVIDRRATADDRTQARKAGETFIAATKKKAPSEESYARQLTAVGMSVEEFEARAMEQALVEQVINRELRDKLNVNPEEVRAFYAAGEDVRTRSITAADPADGPLAEPQIAALKRANLARLDRPERVTAQLLLLYTVDRVTREPLPLARQEAKRELATELRQRLLNGEDFTRLATQYSDDPDVEQTGGEYVAARNAPMAPELKARLFSLPVGQWSDIIDSRFGLYLARIKDRQPAGKIPYEEAESDIRQLLLAQKVEQKLPDYFDALKTEFGVVVTLPAER
ncbi:MAG: peptidylprolyl isomerase [Verrucomicrobiales bacterium]|nr:peptidylprolyl isomerase [Verrucomicrobiales bacterium]MCP5525391.1 peptidylprolyl isomerase [Verrucomicrobiales bacterium]